MVKPETQEFELSQLDRASGKATITSRAFDLLVATYRATLSPMIGPACRFHPTCSEYARQAVHRHGLRHGIWMALRRLARCHPFHPGGWDPVR